MLYDLSFTFIIFIICSFIGKIGEITLCSIMHKKFVNRGFLIGPYVPIWGVGVLILGPILSVYKSNPITVFFVGILVGLIVEYVSSYILEKIYNARWWDYSYEKININGRICLSSGIVFGLAGLIYLYLFKPNLINFLESINHNTLIKISVVLFTIFMTDVIISGVFALYLKKNKKLKGLDCTENMKKEIRKVLFRM